MGFYLSPLVDVKEIDLTTTVPAVATNIGVSIIRNAYRGPELKKTLITSVDQLISKFGKPRDKVYDSSGNSTSISNCYEDILGTAAFLRTSDMCYVTAVRPPLATFAGSRVPSAGSGNCTFNAFSTAFVLSDMPSEDPDLFNEKSFGSDTSVFWIIAKDRGYGGNNIRVAIMDKNTQDLVIARDSSVTSWDTYNAFSSVDVRLQDQSEFVILVQVLDQGLVDTEDNWEDAEILYFSLNEDQRDDQGKNIFGPNVVNTQSEYIRINISPSYTNPSSNVLISTSSWQQLTDGADHDGDTVADGDIEEALDLYANPEEIDVNLFLDLNKSETVKSYMISICDRAAGGRGDAMVILDPKYDICVNNRGNEAYDLIDWRRGLGSYTSTNLNENTSFAALYGNWAEVYDKWSQKYRWIPIAGHIGGVYAFTDASTDPWYAPAGLNRGILYNIRRLAWNPTKGERDLLYKNGINPVIAKSGKGKVVWGQKTLYDKPSAFNRVNVRRLFIVLEKAISTAAEYYLFEPNTAFTRLQLRNMINPFLRDVKSREGIYDFLVVCDETNNTGERIDRNELWVDIYIKPTRAAEYIVLNFIATKTSANFTEIALLRAA